MTKNNLSQKYNTFSIIGFILGIISFFLNLFGLMGILALIFSSIGLYQIYKNNQDGKTLCILGILFGTINITYALLLTLFIL